MTALHKKATGWGTSAEVTNQKPVEDLGVKSSEITISEIIALHNYRNNITDPAKFEPVIANGKVYFPKNMMEKDINAYYKRKALESLAPKWPTGFCQDCHAYCDGKHYRGEGKKDYRNPEDYIDETFLPELN